MLEVTFLLSDKSQHLVIDQYVSLLWTERYDELGEFELVIPYNLYSLVIGSMYLTIEVSETIMKFEDIQESYDAEVGRTLTLKGRSVACELELRVTEGPIFPDKQMAYVVQDILMENLIAPTNPGRIIPGWLYDPPTDPSIFGPWVKKLFDAGTLYDILRLLCAPYGIGFTVTMDADRNFVFKLVNSTYRAYDQTERPPVIFSDDYDNLKDSSFFMSERDDKNVAVVITEDEDPLYRSLIVWGGGIESTGLARRETITDARDVRRNIGSDVDPLTDAEMEAIMWARGMDDLSLKSPINIFEGTVDLFTSFRYGVDFFLGDIVQHDYDGRETTARIVEIIHSVTASEDNVYASFDYDYIYTTGGSS